MKIVNICLTGPYNEGWGYQENLLSKYQRINGDEVTIITSRFITSKNKNTNFDITEEGECINENKVKVIRLDFFISKEFSFIFRKYKKLYSTLLNEKPDIIFVHGVQSFAIYDIIRYKKNFQKTLLFIDNHADFTNTALKKSGEFINKVLWKRSASKIEPYVEKFFGVLPVRCDFLNEMYGIDKKKIELLVMGADDEQVTTALTNKEITNKKYKLGNYDFTILTGGKIDKYKTETLELMKVVNDMSENIKLIVFGSVDDELKDEFSSLLSNKITYINWLNQQEIYNLLVTVSIAVYPGRHSVIWEQSIGAGCVSVFRHLNKSQHVNVNNNCLFLQKADYNEIKDVILKLYYDKDFYNDLKRNTEEYGKKFFSYKEIAKKSIISKNNY
jgi:glycosyltransferase involved in cell wall biosynthesis